jgi:hypothetical protein
MTVFDDLPMVYHRRSPEQHRSMIVLNARSQFRVGLPVLGAIVVQLGSQAAETTDLVDRFTPKYGT